MSNNITIGVSVNPSPSAAERLDRIKTAWERVAPEATFANMGLTQFTTTVGDFKRQLEGINSLRAGLKAGIGDHRATGRDARRLIRRVVSGVLADAVYGPDSALYRAMGFVRASERKSPSAPAPATASETATGTGESLATPRRARVGMDERLEKVLSGWNEIAPEAKFGGMTMAEFQLAITPYLQARSGVEATRTRIKAEVAHRDGAESAARKLAQRIVAAVRADGAFGDDSSLYRAMGYRPASERRSRKRSGAATSQPETSAATAMASAVGAPK